MSEITKIHQIMQYALLVAAQGDWHERALSPIHIIKYLYLADMDHAKFNQGKIFTGIDWKFHHFGPWSLEAFQQIDNAFAPLKAKKTISESNYGDKDYTRWSVDFNKEKFTVLRDILPLDIKQSVQHYVGSYHNNTTALLHFVYATRPMLHAAPGEFLDFSLMPEPKTEAVEEYVPYIARLSNKKRKRLKQGMDELRERFRQRMAEKASVPYPVDNAGKIDAVFENGVAWLDGLAGDPFPEKGATIHFTNEVWKSEARRGDV